MVSPSAPRHLLHAFPTFQVGGAQVRFAAIANHFHHAFRHTLIAMDGRYGCRERLDPDVRVEYLDPAINKGNTFGNIREFRTILRTIRPDTLVTYNWGSIEWAMANWPRLVRHVHIEDGFGPEEAQRQFRRRMWTRRAVLSRSTVIVPSISLQTIATQVWKLDPARVRYIPNGVDCARFAGEPDASPSTTWTGLGPVIGTVAALRREKNIERLLRAFQRVAARYESRLVIVGDGPERAALQRTANQLGIGNSVTFCGHLANPERAYRSFDIFALSSDTEQMPYTIIEAMAAGLAIGATDVGDVCHMVAAENQPYISAPSDELLANALSTLVSDIDKRQKLGMANQAKARREFDQKKMFATYGSLFRGSYPSLVSTQIPAAPL